MGDTTGSILATNGAVARSLQYSAVTPPTEEPPTGVKAAKLFGDRLTFYEKKEIESYPEVYYAGQNCKNKVKAPTSGFNDGYDSENGEYTIVEGDHIAYRYEIICHLGSGAFGQVVKALDHMTGSLVAVKLIRNKKKVAQQAKMEVRILEHIKDRDPYGKYSIVQMLANFTFREHICIVYELLGTNLYDHMESTDFYPMSLTSVRKVAARVLIALTFLWKENVIHCDLKPENILYKTDASTDVVKVADLGSACYDSRCAYTYIQSRFYRAPEVILGLPYGRPIDLWSFGCILCELATGYPLFPGENEKDQMACIMELLGKPPASMITASKKRRLYFDDDLEPIIVPNSKGRIRSPGSKALASFLGLTQDDLFVSFVDQFLCWDPDLRVAPRQAMKHPWIEDEFVFSVPPRKEVDEVSPGPQEQPAAKAVKEVGSPHRADGARGGREPGSCDEVGGPRDAQLSLPENRGLQPLNHNKDERDKTLVSSSKRFRPVMLTLDVAGTPNLQDAGAKGGDRGPGARSIVSATHNSVGVSVPSASAEAKPSSCSDRGQSGETSAEAHVSPANGVRRAQPLLSAGVAGEGVQARRGSVPVSFQGASTSGARSKGQTDASPTRKGLVGSLSLLENTLRAQSATNEASDAGSEKGVADSISASQGVKPLVDKLHVLLSNARVGQRLTEAQPSSSVEAANYGVNRTVEVTAGEHNLPASRPELRGERAKTATMVAACGVAPRSSTEGKGSGARRRESGLPALQPTSLPLSSPPVAVPSSNRELRELSEAGSRAPPSTSRRHEYAAQRQAQKPRETVMASIPDNLAGTTQTHLPPL